MLKNKIRELRKSKGLSQTALAELSGTTQNTISDLETGRYSPTAHTALMICKVLGCRFEDCFYLE